MEIGNREIEQIVQQVIANLGVGKASGGDYGVFENMSDAIDAAYIAQKDWYENYNVKAREKIIAAIRKVSLEHAEDLAKRVHEETKMGRYEDKIIKHIEVINGTPGTECLTTDCITGDSGLMIEEYAPFGVIGAITPTTNPTETIINNTISMIAGGNSVVYNVHPGAKKVCAYCLQMLNKTIQENGGPANLITMVKEPTMDTVNVLTASPKIRLMVSTGGMPMVNSLLRSGKKTIGAGAGNPPVVVDATADIELAAKEVYRGASFDNNLLCLAEKEVFVEESVADQFVNNMVAAGAYLMSPAQTEQLLGIVFKHENGKYDINKKWVGQDASKILAQIGVQSNTRLAICVVPHDHPFVLVEQLMPVLPIVKCPDFKTAVDWAIIAESANRHTAGMFSKDVDHMTYLAKRIETTIFAKNGSTLKGVGIGGEGHCTMTIAGPTGEGLTCAKSFTRRRRCQLADGGLRII